MLAVKQLQKRYLQRIKFQQKFQYWVKTRQTMQSSLVCRIDEVCHFCHLYHQNNYFAFHCSYLVLFYHWIDWLDFWYFSKMIPQSFLECKECHFITYAFHSNVYFFNFVKCNAVFFHVISSNRVRNLLIILLINLIESFYFILLT